MFVDFDTDATLGLGVAGSIKPRNVDVSQLFSHVALPDDPSADIYLLPDYGSSDDGHRTRYNQYVDNARLAERAEATVGACIDLSSGVKASAGARGTLFGLIDAETALPLFQKRFSLFEVRFPYIIAIHTNELNKMNRNASTARNSYGESAVSQDCAQGGVNDEQWVLSVRRRSCRRLSN